FALRSRRGVSRQAASGQNNPLPSAMRPAPLLCLSGAAISIPPLDGEGGARLGAPGGVSPLSERYFGSAPTPASQERRRTSPQGGGMERASASCSTYPRCPNLAYHAH